MPLSKAGSNSVSLLSTTVVLGHVRIQICASCPVNWNDVYGPVCLKFSRISPTAADNTRHCYNCGQARKELDKSTFIGGVMLKHTDIGPAGGEIAVTERIDVSLDRIRSIIDELPPDDDFSTGDAIRAYSGVFCSNLSTPAHYSFNAQFGKLLKRNESNLGIRQIDESRPATDDHGHPTSVSIWQRVEPKRSQGGQHE